MGSCLSSTPGPVTTLTSQGNCIPQFALPQSLLCPSDIQTLPASGPFHMLSFFLSHLAPQGFAIATQMSSIKVTTQVTPHPTCALSLGYHTHRVIVIIAFVLLNFCVYLFYLFIVCLHPPRESCSLLGGTQHQEKSLHLSRF